MGEQSEGSPKALLLGAILDGIPESAVIGLTLISGEGVGVAVVAAVFLSNFPEGLSSSAACARRAGRAAKVLGVWVAGGAGLRAVSGARLRPARRRPRQLVGLINAFAAGAVLTMLSDVMFPEAIRHGGKAAGLVTALGFAVAFLLTTLD